MICLISKNYSIHEPEISSYFVPGKTIKVKSLVVKYVAKSHLNLLVANVITKGTRCRIIYSLDTNCITLPTLTPCNPLYLLK